MGKQTLRPAEWVAGVRELMVRYEIARSGTGDEDTAGMTACLGTETTTWPSAPVSSQRRGRARCRRFDLSPGLCERRGCVPHLCIVHSHRQRDEGRPEHGVRWRRAGREGLLSVFSIVHSHHLHDEGGSGRGPAARCDGDGPDRVLTATPKSCRFPACRLSTSWLGNDATFPRLPAPCKRQKSPPLRRPIQTFPERQSLRRSAHAFDAPSFSPS